MSKVLSFMQPYAELIKTGKKTIDTRTWKTEYRGKLFVHASATKISKSLCDNSVLMGLVKNDKIDYGCIICSCELVDCIKMTDEYVADMHDHHYEEYLCGIYESGRYAWILKNIEVLDIPIPAKGHLGLWDYKEAAE